MSSFSIARGSTPPPSPPVPLPPPAGPVPSWLSYLVLLYVLCLLYVLPSPPSCSSINAGSPLTANHHFQFSVVQRLRHLLSLCPSRASSCPSATSAFCRFSFFFLFKMRGTVKKLRNIISETEERLLAVPVRAAAAESWSLVRRDLMRRRLGLFGKRTC